MTGSINQELLLRNEYLTAENHILKSQIKGRLRLSDGERATLAGIAKRLGRKALQEIACTAKPDTMLAWYRKLVAQKFDGSKKRGLAGRPRVDAAIEALVVKLARENSGWGYDRIVGAVANLGHEISDQSVGNILRRHGIAPAPKRKQSTTWSDFIRSHLDVLAGTDFFTVEVLTWRGLATYYVLFFIHLGNRRVSIAGITDHPDSIAMEQMARNATLEELGVCTPADIFCMIGTPSSANGSGANSRGSQPLARSPASLPRCPRAYRVFNCPFLIFSANSRPPMTTAAVRKLFHPSIGRSRCFSRR